MLNDRKEIVSFRPNRTNVHMKLELGLAVCTVSTYIHEVEKEMCEVVPERMWRWGTGADM